MTVDGAIGGPHIMWHMERRATSSRAPRRGRGHADAEAVCAHPLISLPAFALSLCSLCSLFLRARVVDSEDLPLNVSRETLAQSRVLKVMAKKITRKVLAALTSMAAKEKTDSEDEKTDEEKKAEEKDEADKDAVKEEDMYPIFWKEFGKSIKLGCIDDRANKAKLAKLLRYQTTKSDGKLISLETYVERMKSTQKHIYYITGENLESVKSSPFLERVSTHTHARRRQQRQWQHHCWPPPSSSHASDRPWLTPRWHPREARE